MGITSIRRENRSSPVTGDFEKFAERLTKLDRFGIHKGGKSVQTLRYIQAFTGPGFSARYTSPNLPRRRFREETDGGFRIEMHCTVFLVFRTRTVANFLQEWESRCRRLTDFDD